MKNKKKSDVRTVSNGTLVPYVVLGLSFGALGLSIYAVTGGPVDDYIASRQTYVAHADTTPEANENATNDSTSVDSGDIDIDEIVGKGTYDVTVSVDDAGKRSYVLTPIESESPKETADKSETSDDTATDSKESDKVSSDADKEKSDESSDAEGSASDQDAELSDEAKAELEEHKSMRLRMKPDRQGSDIYYYVVEAGDSLAEISEHFNVPLGQLMEDNHIQDGNVIFVGEVIFMPTDFVK